MYIDTCALQVDYKNIFWNDCVLGITVYFCYLSFLFGYLNQSGKFHFYPINRNLRTDMKNERSLPGDDATIIEPRPIEGRRRLWALLDFIHVFWPTFRRLLLATWVRITRKIYDIFEVNLGSVRVILLYNPSEFIRLERVAGTWPPFCLSNILLHSWSLFDLFFIDKSCQRPVTPVRARLSQKVSQWAALTNQLYRNRVQ